MLQFSLNGRRYTVRLNLPDAALQQIRLNVRRLVECRQAGVQPDAGLQGWAEATTGRLRKRLADAGLVRPESDTALGPYLAARVAAIECGDLPRRRYQRTADAMVRFWGASRPIESIADGRAFADVLGPDGNRRRRMLLRARRLLPGPFDGMKLSLKPMPDKKRFVSREVVERVMDGCDDPQLRAVIALARFAGLRTPSESSRLMPSDIDWAHGRFTVHGKGERDRLVPLFPEVREALECVLLPLGIHGRELGGMTMAARLRRACRRVGVRMWPVPWHSLRSSCESELLTRFPHHVVCSWMGHTAAVSLGHYARPLEEHWEKATRPDAGAPSASRPASAASVTPVLLP